MKKLCVCLLALICLFGVFSGCSKDNIKTDKNIEIETKDIPEGVVIANEGKDIYLGSKEGKTRLKITYSYTGYGRSWAQAMAAHFVAENPNYWVFLDGDPGITNSVQTKLDTGINLSDLYVLNASNSNIYAENGWLADLSDVYNSKPDGENGKSVYDKMNTKWQYYCWAENKGVLKQYVYPWTEYITGIAYNAGMFEKYGWQVPTTTDELEALCKKIMEDTNGKVSPFVYPGSVGGYYGYLVASWWLQASGIDEVEKFYKFESSEVFNYKTQPGKGKYDALAEFQRFFGPNANYSLKGSMSKNHIEAQLSFIRGEAAMIPNASWLENETKADMPNNFKLRLMRTPYLKNARKNLNGEYEKFSYACSPDYMIIPELAKEKKIAKDFLKFMARDDMLLLFTKYAGTLRPFDYDAVTIESELTDFTKSCLEISNSSIMFFETSRSPLYKAGYVQTYLGTTNPFPSLTYPEGEGGGITLEKFVKKEYFSAKENWDRWVENSKMV